MSYIKAMRSSINDLYDLITQERLRNDANSREPAAKKEFLLIPFLMMTCAIKGSLRLQRLSITNLLCLLTAQFKM
ncbi:MAG: hypothetical protein O2809_04275 [Proteobacteria bacterium]|nr:hypothetical protein [Pseudomonadota bacterium]